jgi:aminopeptidase N
MLFRLIVITLFAAMSAFSQAQQSGPPIEPGVSQALAQWRAAHYSDVRYKLNLTLEKMSPVLKGTMEIRVNVSAGTQAPSPANAGSSGVTTPIILDWRKIKGHEDRSTISNVSLNGVAVSPRCGEAGGGACVPVEERDEHLIFRDGVVAGENVIKLDFTSPILTSGSAITRYVDKEDGAEYIYSLFVPSDASTAFPVFDQPDLKARFSLSARMPKEWTLVSNSTGAAFFVEPGPCIDCTFFTSAETKPISTYVYAFAAGPFEAFADKGGNLSGSEGVLVRDKGSTSPTPKNTLPTGRVSASGLDGAIYVRKSQAAKFKPHAAEVFRLNREGIKYLETYFDYKFPFPKYDLVLIPEFPFGGMEHAGATFLREASIIFPTEPTKSDHISRANLIFHEAAHQWFGDTVTMRWFDDLWLKEGFAEFMAYKTLEKVMPEANAWKVFYERNKQAAYATDSTKGTTPIYQKIDNLSAAKSAYGNIVYRKAPSFLRQAEFYLGEQKFQTAARAFLKKHEFANAGWEDLLREFETLSGPGLDEWASVWLKQSGLFKIRVEMTPDNFFRSGNDSRINDALKGLADKYGALVRAKHSADPDIQNEITFRILFVDERGKRTVQDYKPYERTDQMNERLETWFLPVDHKPGFVFPNYQDYGYGIFLLDAKSRDYVLKNIQNEKDPFLRSMMWGSLWDSVHEAELDPQEYVELAIRQLGGSGQKPARSKGTRSIEQSRETDETIIQSLLGRVGTAMNYYMSDMGGNATVKERATTARSGTLVNTRVSAQDDLRARLEAVLLDRLQHAPTAGQRITFYRAFVTTASTAKGREVLKEMLKAEPPVSAGGKNVATKPMSTPPANTGGSALGLRTKDKFDIVTRLIILGDPDAPKLLAQLEKTETGDDAKRYAYAARAGIATAENKAKYWSDFTANKDISESWIEAAFGPFNSVRHSDLTLPYLERALAELPNHKRTRKIFFVNGWLGAFIGGQKSETALAIVNKFLADNPNLDRDLRLKILENVDLIERAVKIRSKYGK